MTQKTKKIQGTFYPLTVHSLIKFCSMLTDAELKVLLYLKALHPFTDSYKELDTSQMAEHLNISRRSVQRFLKKFKHFNLIEYELNRFKYKTTAGSPHQEEATPGSPKRHQDRQNDPRIAKATPGSPKRHQDRQNDPRIAKATPGSPKRHQDRFDSPECPSDNDPGPSQTLQTLQTNQTSQTIQMGVEGVENSGSDPDLDLVNKKIEDYEQNYSQQEEVKQEKQINPKDPKQDRSSATVVQDTTKRCTTQPPVIQDTTKRCTKSEEIGSQQKGEVSSNGNVSNVCKIPQDLINKLEELHIPLDEKVRKAVSLRECLRQRRSSHLPSVWSDEAR